MFTRYLASTMLLLLLFGCASVRVYDHRYSGEPRKYSRWQTGLIGMFNDDIKIDDINEPVTIQVTWNKISQWFISYIRTSVHLYPSKTNLEKQRIEVPSTYMEKTDDSLKNVEKELIKLEEMKQTGIITEEEYLKLKSKIIEKY